ncbi:cytochrome P450 [Lojkania enalia]|uniref:Cytochrome P450 n=1 Tax=Lojkania enalia TaxID=147567 RepID=A0A9P4K125_9PLEO|nr:cytochrome P450 [Didymosphaeria enalia]
MAQSMLYSWPTFVFALFIAVLGHFLYSGYVSRSRVNRLRRAGLPMPQWNWVTGHLLVFKHHLSRYPSDTFVSVIIADMARQFPTELFYLDLWPFLDPALIVCSPEAATQVSNTLNLPKPRLYKTIIDPITGGPNILTTNGKEWKYWRSLLNPGFASAHMLDQVSAIVDSVEIFCDQLRKRGDVFRLEDVSTRLTVDIIMKVVLDLDLDYLRVSHPLADALLKMISWSSFGNPFYRFHPIRPFIIKYYGNVMQRIVLKELNKRFEEYTHRKWGSSIDSGSDVKSKSVMALTVESYKTDKEGKISKLDSHFATFASHQVRLFLFAGHDTTTSVLVYVYHMLHEHPEALARVRKEHSKVFGTDPRFAAPKLRDSPALLNQIPYTLAVIKETMRLYPPSGALREGVPGACLSDLNGTQYPTNGCIVSQLHYAIHYNSRVWPHAKSFLPERWLVDAKHELYPPPGAFRSFEQGPRNCIGQTLSFLELRIALVMTVRIFRIRPAYEEWDGLKEERWIKRVLKKYGFARDEKSSINGERAYQVEKGGAHPKDGYPCKIELLETA